MDLVAQNLLFAQMELTLHSPKASFNSKRFSCLEIFMVVLILLEVCNANWLPGLLHFFDASESE